MAEQQLGKPHADWFVYHFHDRRDLVLVSAVGRVIVPRLIRMLKPWKGCYEYLLNISTDPMSEDWRILDPALSDRYESTARKKAGEILNMATEVTDGK